DGIEHDNDRWTHQDRIRNADRIRIGWSKLLHHPHHVIAEIPEHTGRHWRQVLRQDDAAFGDQRAQRRERWFGAGGEGIWVAARRTIDVGFALHRAPDQIWLESDNLIAPADCAVLVGLGQKTPCLAAAKLEKLMRGCLY